MLRHMTGSVKPSEPCDVLVIGAGAAGGALTWRPALLEVVRNRAPHYRETRP